MTKITNWSNGGAGSVKGIYRAMGCGSLIGTALQGGFFFGHRLVDSNYEYKGTNKAGLEDVAPEI